MTSNTDEDIELDDVTRGDTLNKEKQSSKTDTDSYWHVFFARTTANNVNVFLIFVVLAVLATTEDVNLTQSAARVNTILNVYCSDETTPRAALSNRIFVFGRDQLFENRDTQLGGVCSSSTIEFVSAEYIRTESDTPCNFTIYDKQEACADLSREELLQEFIVARRTGLSADTLTCSISNTVCAQHSINNEKCEKGMKARVQVSNWIGIVGLMLYPFIFYYHVFNFSCYIIILTWGIIMNVYHVDFDNCEGYTFRGLTYSVIPFSVVMLVLNIVLLLVFSCTGAHTSWRVLEHELRKRNKN